MTKANMKRYILKHQVDIDERIVEQFAEIPYTKEELDEFNYRQMQDAFNLMLDAEDMSDNLYREEFIKHGRSE